MAIQSHKAINDEIRRLFGAIDNSSQLRNKTEALDSLSAVLEFVKIESLLPIEDVLRYQKKLDEYRKNLNNPTGASSITARNSYIPAGRSLLRNNSLVESLKRFFDLSDKKKFLIVITTSAVVIGTCVYIFSRANSVQPITKKTDSLNNDSNVSSFLNFRGVLFDNEGLPINRKVDVYFSLYASENDTEPVYRGSCVGVNGITPDFDGSFEIAVGRDCGMAPIPSRVVQTYNNLYLGIQIGAEAELKPRHLISTIQNARDSDSIRGVTLGASESSIPFINDDGVMVIAAESPVLRSTQGTFTLEGNTVLLATSSESGGDIELRPDLGGSVLVSQSKLGINTLEPAYELDVAGNMAVSGGIHFTGRNAAFYQGKGGSFGFYTDQDVTDLTRPTLSILGGDRKGVVVNGVFQADGTIAVTGAEPSLQFDAGSNLYIGSRKNRPPSQLQDNRQGSTSRQNRNTIILGSPIAPSKSNLFSIGSETMRWAAVYTNAVYLPNEGNGGYWKRKANALTPTWLQDDILLGSEAVSSATVKLSSSLNGRSFFMTSAVGIGTREPQFPLTVVSQGQTAAGSIINYSTIDTPETTGVRISLGTPQTGTRSRFIEFYSSATRETNGRLAGAIRLNNGGVVYESGGADFAEIMRLVEPAEAGDIVGIGDLGPRKARPGDRLVGVVSDVAAFIGNTSLPDHPNNAVVGLIGQVRTFVTTENGPIRPGVPITISHIPGVGMASTSSAEIVGIVVATAEEVERELSTRHCDRVFAVLGERRDGVKCGRVTVLVNIRYDKGVPKNSHDQESFFSSQRVEKERFGNVKIPRGSTSVFVPVPISDRALILLTPVSPDPVTARIVRQVSCLTNAGSSCVSGFEVRIDKELETDVRINYVLLDR